ncbi:unnamed protein product [Phytophthora lilii]|uniref:Unnamed protein product n=1 Tax=Phytophthora lilii TaxID=2077276 RepID=A0A9W6TAP3_9STRA|nr:unnamed protein product [Phytophthora lilii]
MMQIQNAAMTLLLTVVWRDEARAFLHSGGVAVLANVLTSEAVLAKTTIELALAQALYYVSMHWPDETWSEVISTGIGKWIEVIETRCEGESDGLVQYLLASMKTLLYCEVRFM